MSMPASLPNPPAGTPPLPPARRASAPPEQPYAQAAQARAPQVLAPAVLRQQQADLRYQEEVASVVRSRNFRDLRFRINNYFEYNRRGLVPEYQSLGQQPWNDALRDPTWALVPYERQALQGAWDRIYENPFGDDDEAVRAQQAANIKTYEAPGAGFIRPKHETGDAFTIRLRRSLRRQGLDIRSLRHLGAGGWGLVTLFEVRSSRSGVRKKFVIKSSRRPNDPALPYEKRIQMSLRRAPHIVRSLLWANDILTEAPIDAEGTERFCQEMDNRKDLIYLEFMKGGCLFDLLGKAVAAGVVFPNSVLWNAFFCLVRACIAMEYPPRLQIHENGDWAWGSETGDDGEERVPNHQKEGCGLVHFDLDPKNVMIGDNDEDHPAVPVFKVGDFGVASMPRNPTFENRNSVWMTRKAGKRRHQLPEQFHREWEYVRVLPNDEYPVPKVAGNYGPASNIWAIGMVLHDMITQTHPPDPPAAFGPMNGPDASLMPDGIPSFRDVDGKVVDPFYTHGSWLGNADNIDKDLKGLLIRCLADQPAHRPTLKELNTYLDKADRILAWNDDPDDRDWYEKLTSEPPDAVEKVDPILNDVNNQPGPPAVPQAAQDDPQRTGTRLSDMLSAGLSRLQALLGVGSNARPPQPPQPEEVPVSDDAAYLFTARTEPLLLTSEGAAVLNPNPDAALNPAPDADERAAGPLPASVSTPGARQSEGTGGATSSAPSSGPNGPSPFSVVTGADGTSPESQSSEYMSAKEGPGVASADDRPALFLTTFDPAGRDQDGEWRPGNPREIVLLFSQGTSVTARELVPFLTSPPGTAPPALPLGYQYGRASASAPRDGQVVPPGVHTIRIDAVDPARGGVPNVFFRDLNFGGGAAPRAVVRDAADRMPGDDDKRDPPPAQEDRGIPRVPKVTAMRIPSYGLFERPPARPRGFHYGRRLYLSPAEVRALENRGIRAPPGRMVIRLVHVDVVEGDSYERPTIFYKMEPQARAPLPPSHDPEPNILYATLPVL